MKEKNSLKLIDNKTIALLFSAIFLLSSFSSILLVVAEEQAYQNITVDTAYKMIKKEKKFPDIIILDVRDQYEFDMGHLYDAILIPYADLEARISELEEYVNIDIIIYCKAGGRSQLASELLVNCGFTRIYNMLGGIFAWIDANYPIWTTTHHVTVNSVVGKKVEMQIEPLLLHLTGCSSCDDNQGCFDDSELITITSMEVEQDENYMRTHITYVYDEITYEITIVNTLLWSYSELANEIKKTAYFISTEITTEDMYTQYYQLIYISQHEEYNFTLHTDSIPSIQKFITVL